MYEQYIDIQELAHQRITLHVTQTTQYLQHPSTLKAKFGVWHPVAKN